MKTVARSLLLCLSLGLSACGGSPGGPPPSTSSMTVIMDASGCSSSTFLSLRLFDRGSGGQILGTYGANGAAGEIRQTVTCETGNPICMGGKTTTGSIVQFGVGYTNTQDCTDCCVSCAMRTVTVPLDSCP